ncbi:Uncharacterised protein [Enterobacter hormaechei]|nr:Uncharacterised protein [Enterobacter hormaechei]
MLLGLKHVDLTSSKQYQNKLDWPLYFHTLFIT